MPRRFGPRFAIEAVFIILVAAGAGAARLSTPAIVFVIALAWLLVALTEWIIARERPFFAPPAHETEEAPAGELPPAPVYPPYVEEAERAEAQTLLGAVVPADSDAAASEPPAAERDPWEQGPAGEVVDRSDAAETPPRRWFRRRKKEASDEETPAAESPAGVEAER